MLTNLESRFVNVEYVHTPSTIDNILFVACWILSKHPST